MVYAGAQKNLGPAGTVLVVIHKDMLERCSDSLPLMLNYKVHAEKGSCLNTPPSFGIYLMGQVFKWILSEGGLSAIEERNERKAAMIYDAIESSDGFYSLFDHHHILFQITCGQLFVQLHYHLQDCLVPQVNTLH